jgi:RNA-directed DNA polymerase
MGAETFPRPGKEAAGSRHEPGVARQAVTAAAEPIGPPTETLMEEVLRRENLLAALKRVQANKGAPGVDGMTVDELAGYLRKAWPAIREQLLQATYVPAPVREVQLPKPGGGTRRLGIPTVLDRVITQAILQVMSPLFESGFSDHSYGFRPGRRAHQAVEQACQYLAEGYRWVVEIDLEKFFDQVNHDMLMSRVAKNIKAKRLLKLIRQYLTAGILKEGLVSQRDAGTPQGSPLSPLLSNIRLDSFDKELDRRGHRFCRDADDANVYVRSQRAGERVLASLTHFLEAKLRLKVNRAKSAVDRPWKRKFLGDTGTNQRAPRLKPALESIKRAKARIRQITHQGRGRNIRQVIQEINRFTRGWIGYFRLATVLHAFEGLDQWLRRRLRKILWEQWRKPKTRYRKLVALGVDAARARKATATGRGAWWNAGASHMHAAVTNRLLAEWGLLSLLDQRRAWQGST